MKQKKMAGPGENGPGSQPQPKKAVPIIAEGGKKNKERLGRKGPGAPWGVYEVFTKSHKSQGQSHSRETT